MGRDASDLFPTRPAEVPEPPHDVHRTAVPGPQCAHEETRDPGRRDRRHVGRASELREAAGAGTAGREDPPGLSREDLARDVCGLRRPVYRDGERDGPEPDGAEGPPPRGHRGRRPGGPERLHRGPRGRLLQRGHRTRPRGNHRETQGRPLCPWETEQGLDQDQEEDDPRLRDRRHHGGRGRAGGHVRFSHPRRLPRRIPVPRRAGRDGLLRGLPPFPLPAARGPTPGRMSVPRGAGDRRSRGLLDPARPRGRGAFPRVLQGTPHARPLVLAAARGQASGRLHRDVLGGLFAIGRNPVLTRQRESHQSAVFFSSKRSDRGFDSFKGRGRGTDRNQGTPMAKLQLTDVEIFVKDLKATRAFYTRKIGLKVRSAMPKWGYLALGATKGGEDAALTPWQPVPEWGQEMYESRLKMIGGVTGIGFITNDLKRTIADLKKKGVKTAVDGESETFGRFTDPAGNVLFLAQPAKPKVRRAGVSALGFVTVASRDSKKTGEFFRKTLGMRKQRAESDEEGFDSYQLSPKATAITPFTPRKDIYDNPADYDADMAHIGEETGIGDPRL